MSSLFGEVWFWSLLAFLIGALLTWVLLVRPAQQRSQQLEKRSHQMEQRARQQQAAAQQQATQVAEPVYRQPERTDWPVAPERDFREPEPQSRTQWLERDSLPPQRSTAYADDTEVEDYTEAQGLAGEFADDYPESGGYAVQEPYLEESYAEDFATDYPQAGGYHATETPAVSSGFDALDEAPAAPPVEPEEALPTQRVQPEVELEPMEAATTRVEPEELAEATAAVEPAEVEEYLPTETPAEPESGFFDEEQPTTSVGTDGQLPDLEPDFDPATGLPKRTRGASNRIRGGFEPPKPIQPSVRPIARRTPSDTTVATGGSLFDPSAGELNVQGPPARTAAASHSVPPGPFGPGSAMPLPGGGRPDPAFTVKGSVTALRYCPEDSPRFGEMTAEVWFASVSDAERVGFRPLGG